MKEELLKRLNEELKMFEEQKESDEYIGIQKLINDINELDFTEFENKLESIRNNDSTAYGFAKEWIKGDIKRIYFNIQNKKGYKYPLAKNYIQF